MKIRLRQIFRNDIQTSMKKSTFALFLLLFSLLLSSTAVAQKRKRPITKPKAKPIVFAVINDGQTLEPIGVIDKGELLPTVGGSDEEKQLKDFVAAYYRPKAVYRLVFGGADDGTVTVKNSAVATDCAKNMAQVTAQPGKAKLKGMVMALATNAPTKKALGVRRLPTAAERAEIETLIRAEFAKQKVPAAAIKNMKYHNLTALDVDADAKAELVGSFWAEPSPDERALLFFIADKTTNGKYAFGYSDFKAIKKDEVMSGEINALDTGVYNELLLDALEYDGDETGEIFTYTQSFEGAGFNVYSRREGKWTKVFEGSNYHCAY